MNKNLIILLVVVLAVGLAWYFWPMPEVEVPEDEVMEEEVEEETMPDLVVVLEEENDSGISGTASFTEMGGELLVVLDLEGAPEGVVQPAHIHLNNCADIGGVRHSLEFPVNGYSETVLETTLDELQSELPLSVNVHKSTDEPQIYVACGDLM